MYGKFKRVVSYCDLSPNSEKVWSLLKTSESASKEGLLLFDVLSPLEQVEIIHKPDCHVQMSPRSSQTPINTDFQKKTTIHTISLRFYSLLRITTALQIKEDLHLLIIEPMVLTLFPI